MLTFDSTGGLTDLLQYSIIFYGISTGCNGVQSTRTLLTTGMHDYSSLKVYEKKGNIHDIPYMAVVGLKKGTLNMAVVGPFKKEH